ncbi:MAG TPA: hypothetical protein VHC72_11485 [Bryobacteraceae bacterium]|nr:hypothetical protein [Bryobacteraceae bacterium]
MNNQWISPPGSGKDESEAGLNAHLDSLFHAYRQACPDPEPSVNFMPELGAKIEARQASTTIFNRMAKALVTAALGASVVMGLLSASYTYTPPPPAGANDGSFLQALENEHVRDLEPLQIERISELEQQ